jgi:hypothetical protein
MSSSDVPAHLKPQRVGLVFIAVGLGFAAWVLYDARSARFFSLRPSLSSVAVAMGLWMVIDSPDLPARELSSRGHAFAGVGLVVGLAFTWYVMGWIPFVRQSGQQSGRTIRDRPDPGWRRLTFAAADPATRAWYHRASGPGARPGR